MTTVDFIFLGVLAVFLLIGFWKGLLGMLLGGFASFLVSLAGAVILGMFIGDLLYGSGVAGSLQSTLVTAIDGINPVFTNIITFGEGGIFLNGVLADTAMQGAGIPGILSTVFSGVLEAMLSAGLIVENMTLTQCIVPLLTRLIVQIATGVAFFLILLIIICIVRHFCAKLLDKSKLRVFDRIVGMAFMAVIACGLAVAVGYAANITNIVAFKTAINDSTIIGAMMKLIPLV